MVQAVKIFRYSLLLTLLALLGVGVWRGPGAALTTIVLIAIEIAFSFDNAIVNAKLLSQLSRSWQQLFLTIGMVVAIVGMRLVFPIIIVALSAGLGFGEVVRLALHEPQHYAHYLELAHPAISAFGGGFLLTLALYFLVDDEREVQWLKRLETSLQKLGGYWWLAPLGAGILVIVTAVLPANHHVGTTLRAGLGGVILYTAMQEGMAAVARRQRRPRATILTGAAAFGVFMYLQLLDASFSFDGVLGAFAITNNIVLIAVGLGVGAIWVRSLTVQLVRQRTLGSYVYLEHGAHYAILALALALLVSIMYEVPDVITGFIGLVIIAAAFQASRAAYRSHEN